ncbi:class I SAM-dependent methyltransferase [Solihabitans fulvus]|uniref:Class I SAM-dependent methyltransferase n=2 Tax=Solihabitans fulvus TaxID=1892852 RepID=A0A5B2XX06_9PSEU|nr:class I SAM-dependent methyltransferase [Solihabitans fulvus]
MRVLAWDHNAHYHRTLLRRLPARVSRALDIGCGTGDFARRLAARADHVDAVDRSAPTVAAAVAATAGKSVRFLVGDALELPLDRYDAISCLASIHHLPFGPAVERLRGLLTPGGTLVILGCYREETRSDRWLSLAAVPANVAMGLGHAVLLTGNRRSALGHRAPVLPASMTLAEIRTEARRLLPGAIIRRHLFWRYTLVYRA